MIKTQIQLTDVQYTRLKQLSERLEVSLAELLRRGADYILEVHAADVADDWALPEPLLLGEPMVDVSEWRSAAYDTDEEPS